MAKSVDISRTERLEARCMPSVLADIRRAASLKGRSLSEFVVTAAHSEAQRTIAEASIIRLAAEEQARFVELMLNPAKPTKALRRAQEAHAALFGPAEP